ncbi:hypothetical protein BC833DRAFT_576212 [Globomyces pollinis-pini]|nr:hypothetical protein BC833DRAFT_576212 [Globomyces pollinis-pini]
MIDFSDNFTNAAYYTTITLLSISILGLLISTFKMIHALKLNNRHRYQLLLIGLNILIGGCVLTELLLLLIGPNWILKWLFNIFDFATFTLALLTELEILRLLEVITEMSKTTFSSLRAFLMIYNVVTGGYHVFYGVSFQTMSEDNIFAKWARWGIFAWYIGISLYVISQSSYITYLIYNHYKGLNSVNRTIIRRQLIMTVASISSLSLLIIVAMLVLAFLVLVLKRIPTINGKKIAQFTEGVISVIKTMIISVYPYIFKNIIGLCLSTSSAREYLKKHADAKTAVNA